MEGRRRKETRGGAVRGERLSERRMPERKSWIEMKGRVMDREGEGRKGHDGRGGEGGEGNCR